MVTYLDHMVIYSHVMVTFLLLTVTFLFQNLFFFKSEERVEEKTMNCKPSSSKTLQLLTRRHDVGMKEVKDKLIRNKLKQATPR